MANAIRHITSARRSIPGKSTELSVVIPAAGVGKRMRSKDPKVLTEIALNTTLIERQLDLIWHVYPKADILLTVGYKADVIRKKLQKYPIRYIYNPLFETTGVAFSISLALQAAISKYCLVIYGDLIFNNDAISSITDGKSKILIDDTNNFNEDEVGLIVDEKKHISNFSFGLSKKWSQIAYLEGKELELFKVACYNEDTIRWFGYEALNQIIDNGGTLESHSVPSAMVFDIDTPQDLQKAKSILN
jgi:choline kinase